VRKRVRQLVPFRQSSHEAPARQFNLLRLPSPAEPADKAAIRRRGAWGPGDGSARARDCASFRRRSQPQRRSRIIRRVLTRLISLIFPISIAILIPTTAAIADVIYRLTPNIVNGEMINLQIEAQFPANDTGRTVLYIPGTDSIDGDWWRLISPFEVVGASVEQVSESKRILTSKPGTTITVRYRVISGYDRDPDVSVSNPYKPIIRPKWFQVLSDRVIVIPEMPEDTPVRFSWGSLPSGWRAITNLEHPTPQTVASARGSLFVGGADLKIIEQQIGSESRLRLAYRGEWVFSPQELVEKIAQYSLAEEALWDEPRGPFTVSLIPLAPLKTMSALGGRGLSESFVIFADPATSLKSMTSLIAHEGFHLWNPGRLGGLQGDDQAKEYWFSEGFTDFFETRLLLKSGLWTLEDFVSNANERLARYGQSKVRNAPNTRIRDAFWKDPEVEKLPYDRGWLLATLWDRRLERRSDGRKNLNSVIRAQRELALQNEAKGLRVSAAKLFPKVYLQSGGGDLGPDLAKYVQGGATIELPADLYGKCATVVTEEIAAFDSGFDGQKSAESGVFTGVDPEGPAYAAGLRDGMRRLSREISGDDDSTDDDSRNLISYRIIDEKGAQRTLSYYPAGKFRFKAQQIRLSPGLSESERKYCTQIVSGDLIER